MTCRYDGRLISTSTGIEPCCADMHRLILGKVVYLGKLTVKGEPTIFVPKIRLDDKVGVTIVRCSFCGAYAENVNSEGCFMGTPDDVEEVNTFTIPLQPEVASKLAGRREEVEKLVADYIRTVVEEGGA